MACVAGNNTSKMATLMRLLKRDIHGAVVESMQQHGIVYRCSWGVSLPAIRKAAASFAPDNDFARFLYGQQIRELQLSAYIIADPLLVMDDDLDFWGEGVCNLELAENLAFSLLSRSTLSPQSLANWLVDDSALLLKYCALLTLARMVNRNDVQNKEFILVIARAFVAAKEIILRNAAENILLRLEPEE